MEKVITQIKYSIKNSPFYKKKLEGYDELLTSSFTHEDYKKIPFTTKDELSSFNEDFLAVERNKVLEYVTTSGTSGNPVTVYLTDRDIERLAKNEFDSLSLMGGRTGDIYQLMTTIDKQFMAGMAYVLGVRKLKAGMIRIGPGVPQMQFESIVKYKPTIIIAVPSFILNLISYSKKNNIILNDLSVKSIVCIGEPIRNLDFSLNILGQRIVSDWNVELFSTYASTEMGAAFSECKLHNGNHNNDDLLYVEVLDEKGNDVKEGEVGEIVFTTLDVEGTPLIRYKSGDLAQVFYGVCKCGKNSLRIGPIIGRKNQMIKYKGTTIFPKSIFDILESHQDIVLYKVEVKKDELGNDDVSIQLPLSIESEDLLIVLKNQFKSKIKIIPNFVFIEDKLLHSFVYPNNKRKPIKIEML